MSCRGLDRLKEQMGRREDGSEIEAKNEEEREKRTREDHVWHAREWPDPPEPEVVRSSCGHVGRRAVHILLRTSRRLMNVQMLDGNQLDGDATHSIRRMPRGAWVHHQPVRTALHVLFQDSVEPFSEDPLSVEVEAVKLLALL
jgi:hypothetical protein